MDRHFYRNAERRDQRSLDALYEAGKILAGPNDPARSLSPVLKVLSSFMGLGHGAVALSTGTRNGSSPAAPGPYVIAATTLSEALQPASCRAIPPPVAETVLRTGVAMVAKNVALELGRDALPSGLEGDDRFALLAAPIRERSTSPSVLGVLSAYRQLGREEPYELDQDLRILTMIASLMAQSLRFRQMAAREREQPPDEARAARKLSPELRPPPASDVVPSIIGNSAEIRAVCDRIRKVAPTRATVLLRGESGTGKELFATAIHRLSDRRDRPLVKVNCAALSETLLESELFGHEKGAFTGAVERKKGRFELADGGTLFLDEIGDISPAFQAKLLRALQEGEFERVGGAKTIKVDVRLIAATNRDLEDAVAKGQFRSDLYFRICVVPIVLPPLRERPDDIPPLAQAFLDRFNLENRAELRFSSQAIESLRGCIFPGNVRELENCVNRVAALTTGPVIDAFDLTCHNDACLSSQLFQRPEPPRSTTPAAGEPNTSVPLPVFNRSPQAAAGTQRPSPAAAPSGRTQREELIEAMERSGWVQAKAARLLGMTPRQIAYALKKHGIDIVKF